MSSPEIREPTESRSSVKLVRNAKGGVQPEVKVYVGDDATDVEYAKNLAIKTFNELCEAYGSGS